MCVCTKMKRHRAAIVFIKEMTGICKYLAFVKYGHDVPLLTIVILFSMIPKE